MGKKVLVVDDEKLIVKGLRFSLEQEGMEVDCAYDGEEALEYARAKEYDIVPVSYTHLDVYKRQGQETMDGPDWSITVRLSMQSPVC